MPLLYISAHGISQNVIDGFGIQGGIILAYFPLTIEGADASQLYMNNGDINGNDEPYIYSIPIQLDGHSEQTYCVIAPEDFWENNTKTRLTNKNSLVFLSTCNGDDVIDNFGGGAVFGFNEDINSIESLGVINRIIKKLNYYQLQAGRFDFRLKAAKVIHHLS